MKQTRVLKIAEQVKQQGLNVVSTLPWTQEEDGAINLDKDFHISVGKSYMTLVREIEGKFEFYMEVTSLNEMVQIVKGA